MEHSGVKLANRLIPFGMIDQMKIILSRKGLDSSSGGTPSPILPDGTLLSMPIPSFDVLKYSDLSYNGSTYEEIMKSLKAGFPHEHCHLDPDLRQGVRSMAISGWKPAFGQTGAALGVLRNSGISIGDIFIFFGLFRKTEYDRDGRLKYVRECKPVQIVYGYLQIGEIIEDPEQIRKYWWHPHSHVENYTPMKNVLFVPGERMSICPELKGYGVLRYRDDRVLTMEGKTAGTWKNYDFLLPDNLVGKRKNCAKGGGIYYQGQWQELVIHDGMKVREWIKVLVRE